MERHDIGRLEESIKEVHERLDSLAESEQLLELIRIIRRPGWTTPAEFQLVNTVVDAIGREVDVLEHLTRELLSASREVSAKAEHATV